MLMPRSLCIVVASSGFHYLFRQLIGERPGNYPGSNHQKTLLLLQTVIAYHIKQLQTFILRCLRAVAEPHSPLGVQWHPQRAKDLIFFFPKI
jgi:hypothetical protein